jgi:hypothetical protein
MERREMRFGHEQTVNLGLIWVNFATRKRGFLLVSVALVVDGQHSGCPGAERIFNGR